MISLVLLVISLPVTALEGAQECGECHSAALKEWNTSMHKYAVEDTIFQMSLIRAVWEYGEEDRDI